MKSIRPFCLSFGLSLTFFIAVSPVCGEQKIIEELQAVQIAVEFVKDNGYTDVPPKKEKFVRESLERSSDVDKILELRQGSLEPRAYGISQGASGWTVVFKYKQPCEHCNPNVGRAVSINADGTNIRVHHQDYKLKAVKKRF